MWVGPSWRAPGCRLVAVSLLAGSTLFGSIVSYGSAIELTHGVATGDVTAHSAVVWARASTRGQMIVRVDSDPAFSDPKIVRRDNSASTDFTAQVRVERLKPGTRYYYRVRFSSDGSARSPEVEGTFVTARAPTQPIDSLDFVVGGDVGGQGFCRDENQGYDIFRRLDALSPDFFIANGDMIYADDDCPPRGPDGRLNVPGEFPPITSAEVDWEDPDAVREIYWNHWRYHRADAHLRRFLAGTPMYVQWDDHEVINDFGARWPRWPADPSREGFPNLVRAGRDALFHYNPIDRDPDDPVRIYRSFRRGRDVELFLIDGRSYRDHNDLPDEPGRTKALLGEKQRQWLERELVGSDATWKIVSSDVPLSTPTGTRAHVLGRDSWANGRAEDFSARTGFERELLMLLGSLDRNDVRNVVFVVTDVHCAMNLRYELDLDGDGDELLFHELVSGPLVAGRLPLPPALDPTLGPTILYAEGGLFNFSYVRLERRDDGLVHLLADVRDRSGAVRHGSRLHLAPQTH